MDQLIPVIEFLKKNKFWIVCGLLSITMIGTWYLSSGRLTKETADGEQAIKQQITSAGNILKVTPEGADDVNAHPNKSTADGMDAEMTGTVESILTAWKDRYDSQSDVRIWPAEIIQSENFVEFFGQFNSPETFSVDETGERMKSLLEIYKQQIPNQMANIAAKAKTQWMFAKAQPTAKKSKESGDARNGERPGAGGGGGSAGGVAGEGGSGRKGVPRINKDLPNAPVVLWDKTNQKFWNRLLTNFAGRDDNRLTNEVPSPLQVFMLQQDLWLLESVFQIIGEVNGDAMATDLAPIKQIDHIAFGRPARAVLGSVREPEAVPGAKGKKELPGARKRTILLGGFRKKTAKAFDDESDNSPFHGRYVNSDYEPIGADVVRNVIGGSDLPDEDLELIVARRIPVRLALIMDETKISEFIAACASSPFTFEIHQVRINMHIPGDGIELKGGKKKKQAGSRGGDNLSTGGGSRGGTEREDGGGAGDAAGDGSVSVGDVDNRSNFDVKVEFYGVVKIYNKVDEARLRVLLNQTPSTKP